MPKLPKLPKCPNYCDTLSKNDRIWKKLSGIVPYGVRMDPIEFRELWAKSCLGMPKIVQICPNFLVTTIT